MASDDRFYDSLNRSSDTYQKYRDLMSEEHAARLREQGQLYGKAIGELPGDYMKGASWRQSSDAEQQRQEGEAQRQALQKQAEGRAEEDQAQRRLEFQSKAKALNSNDAFLDAAPSAEEARVAGHPGAQSRRELGMYRNEDAGNLDQQIRVQQLKNSKMDASRIAGTLDQMAIQTGDMRLQSASDRFTKAYDGEIAMGGDGSKTIALYKPQLDKLMGPGGAQSMGANENVAIGSRRAAVQQANRIANPGAYEKLQIAAEENRDLERIKNLMTDYDSHMGSTGYQDQAATHDREQIVNILKTNPAFKNNASMIDWAENSKSFRYEDAWGIGGTMAEIKRQLSDQVAADIEAAKRGMPPGVAGLPEAQNSLTQNAPQADKKGPSVVPDLNINNTGQSMNTSPSNANFMSGLSAPTTGAQAAPAPQTQLPANGPPQGVVPPPVQPAQPPRQAPSLGGPIQPQQANQPKQRAASKTHQQAMMQPAVPASMQMPAQGPYGKGVMQPAATAQPMLYDVYNLRSIAKHPQAPAGVKGN